MKTIAHMHADLIDMEDGVKGHTGLALECSGTAENYCHIIANLIRVTADNSGIPERVLFRIVEEMLPMEADAEYSRVSVDTDQINRARGEA